MFGTLLDLIKQSRQGVEANKTLRYEPDRNIEHDNDLIDKQYVAKYDELLPENADSLENAALMILSGTQKYTGYLSTDAVAVYAADKPAGSQVAYIIKDASFILQTPSPESGVGDGDKGLMQLSINGAQVDEFDLGTIFDEVNRAVDQAWTLEGGGAVAQYRSANGKIDIFSVGRYNGFSAFQKVVVRLNLVPGDLVVGYNTIELKHTGTNSGDQTSDAFEVFYDTETITPTLDPITLEIESNNNPKYLSGIRFLGTNDVVKVTTAGNKLFGNTYVLNPVDFYGNGFPTTTVAPTDSSVSGLSVPPQKDEIMAITAKLITLSVANKCDADARLTGRPRDPFGTYTTVTSPAQKLLLSTFGISATATDEPFNDESFRLPLTWDSEDKTTAVTGHWDSTAHLANGDAQQFIIVDNDHGLIYPATDFTDHLPANTANYSAFNGTQQYIRAFMTSAPKASIQLTLHGIAAGIGQIAAGDVNVEVKLPTQTGWLDCAKPFDGSAGVANDGDGAMVGSISYSGGHAVLNVTFGGKSTYDANGRMLIRISLRNGNRQVKRIQTNW